MIVSVENLPDAIDKNFVGGKGVILVLKHMFLRSPLSIFTSLIISTALRNLSFVTYSLNPCGII